MTKAKWIAAITGALTVLAAPAAFAAEGLGNPNGGYGTAGLLIGAGTQDYKVFGIGARGGYTLANMPIYIGGTFMYNIGSDIVPGVNVHSFLIAVEAGYDFPVGPVVIRPYLGLGDTLISGSIATACVINPLTGQCIGGASASSTTSEFTLYPGATVMYPIQQFFVGGDVRIEWLPGVGPGGDNVGLGLYATGGMQF